VPALQAQSLEFKLQSHEKIKRERKKKILQGKKEGTLLAS
jgi:hypothetical protein